MRREAVAQAIYEHYLPRFAGDDNPRSPAALVIGLADRLDSLAGLFAAGLAPTGTRDPFAQRRTALGLVQALTAWDLDFDVRQGLALASEGLPVPSTPEIQKACLEFIAGRLRSYLVEQENYRYDVVDAVLAAQQHNPAGAVRAVKQLAPRVAQAGLADDFARLRPLRAHHARPVAAVPARPQRPGRAGRERPVPGAAEGGSHPAPPWLDGRFPERLFAGHPGHQPLF